MTHDIGMGKQIDGERGREAAVPQGAGLRLDKETSTLFNVKILGPVSEPHKRRYSDRAREAACSVAPAQGGFKGAVVNLNHAPLAGFNGPAKTDVRDRFGRLKNIRNTAEGVYGDLKYNPHHSFAKQFEWFAENDPEAMGLSPDTLFSGPKTDDGWHDIQKIIKVFSVDLVADPATTRGLESAMADDSSEPDPVDVDMNVEDGDEEHEQHLANYIASVACNKAMSTEEKKQKILAALKMLDSEPADDEVDDEADDSKEPPTPDTEGTESAVVTEAEAKKLADDMAALRAELSAVKLENEGFRARESAAKDLADARELCNKAQVPARLVTETFLSVMVERGRESWESLIADRKVIVSEKPTSTAGGGNTPPTLDDFVNSYRNGATN